MPLSKKQIDSLNKGYKVLRLSDVIVALLLGLVIGMLFMYACFKTEVKSKTRENCYTSILKPTAV